MAFFDRCSQIEAMVPDKPNVLKYCFEDMLNYYYDDLLMVLVRKYNMQYNVVRKSYYF